VKEGDRVKRGQVLGLLGNSGNSTAPHLHFHVCDSAPVVALASEGLPYVLTAWHKEIPLENDSVDFG
jgi:murein DD-endopeptidase MepM/ murein hydrolase activator NlpD